MEKSEIKIGFKYSRFRECTMSYESHWESYEIVGILYSNGFSGGKSSYKTKECILTDLEKQVQVISLTDMYQQHIFIKSVEDLYKDFKKDSMLLLEHRKMRID